MIDTHIDDILYAPIGTPIAQPELGVQPDPPPVADNDEELLRLQNAIAKQQLRREREVLQDWVDSGQALTPDAIRQAIEMGVLTRSEILPAERDDFQNAMQQLRRTHSFADGVRCIMIMDFFDEATPE